MRSNFPDCVFLFGGWGGGSLMHFTLQADGALCTRLPRLLVNSSTGVGSLMPRHFHPRCFMPFCCAYTNLLHFHISHTSVCSSVSSIYCLSPAHVFRALCCAFLDVDATQSTGLSRASEEELVRRCELNPWLISEHDTVSGARYSENTSSDDCVFVWGRKKVGLWGGSRTEEWEKKTRGTETASRDRNPRCTLFLLCAFIFCCCFTSVQGCAMNWGVANSLQFVKPSLTVVWAVGGGEEGAAADASPPIAEWLLGTGPCWAGPERQNTLLHLTRHCCIKIFAEAYKVWQRQCKCR